MFWNHSVNPNWLAARKEYLTAGDIMRLLPVTPTGRPRANLDEVRLKVWAEKQAGVTEEDIMSTGAMGRGHLLEPYALDEFNKAHPSSRLIHWDDVLVHSADGVACSPDALDIPMPEGWDWGVLSGTDARFVGEVKSYNAEGHYLKAFAPKADLDERWQLATAMHVMPDIETGFLILFNPNARHRLFVHTYDRADLAVELSLIKVVRKEYYDAVPIFETMATARCEAMDDCICESDIIAELLAEVSPLNP